MLVFMVFIRLLEQQASKLSSHGISWCFRWAKYVSFLWYLTSELINNGILKMSWLPNSKMVSHSVASHRSIPIPKWGIAKCLFHVWRSPEVLHNLAIYTIRVVQIDHHDHLNIKQPRVVRRCKIPTDTVFLFCGRLVCVLENGDVSECYTW